MLGFSPISASSLSTTSSIIARQVPYITLKSPIPSIGVGLLAGINTISADGVAEFSSLATGDGTSINLTIPTLIVKAGSSIAGGIAGLALTTIPATYAASKTNNVTISSLSLSTFSIGLNVSSSFTSNPSQINLATANGIPISSAARTGTVIPLTLTSFSGTISATSDAIASINSINMSLPTVFISATSAVVAGITSINFGAMEVAHTFTYFIKSSSYILLGARSSEVKLSSRPTSVQLFSRTKLI